MSAIKCPLDKKSSVCRCAKPGALILHLYGLLDPSETKKTPNSPLGASTALYV